MRQTAFDPDKVRVATQLRARSRARLRSLTRGARDSWRGKPPRSWVADRPLPLDRPSTRPRAFFSMSAAELFAGAGSKPGVEVWRIEKMRPVKQPDGFSGKFHTGDSYIVLHTWERSGATHMNAHFWIGAESTRDEAGAAALLTVELDQLLGDLPTQSRETQGRESDEFLQLFPNGRAVPRRRRRLRIQRRRPRRPRHASPPRQGQP